MRRSVLIPLLVFGLISVVAIIGPTLGYISEARANQLLVSRQAAVDHLVQLARPAIETGTTSALREHLDRHFQVYGESTVVLDLSGEVVASAGELDPERDDVQAAAAVAARNVPQWEIAPVLPWGGAGGPGGSGSGVVAQPVLGSAELSLGTVVLEPELGPAQRDVAVSWGLVIALGIALIAGLVVIALRWTSSVLRPVRALDEAASAFPAHRDLSAISRKGPRELRELTRSILVMTESMEHSLAQQRDFVADASHLLRNPLAAIRLRIDALRVDDEEDEELRMLDEDAARIERIAERMLNLAGVEHRVNAAESGSGPAAQKLRVIRSAEALVSPYRHLHERAGQRLVAVGGEATVNCAFSDLEEMLENALENARKYAGDGATVTVRLTRRGDWTELAISDDGPGLSDDELAQAGARFWRSERTGALPGTGLGLAILTGIARANGGGAEFDRAPEGGLRITIRLRSDER